ncbi:MAG: sigma-70 family RNA polymerase sigma factor [Flavobacteriales bacterium]|nr:sigma-70 family RNA polymerase sigma factor [Flavobacteriales bacterium]
MSHIPKREYTKVNDQELAKACMGGNSKAQALLYERHAGQMMALCLRYGSDYEEAQDMFQEGFIKVFNKLGKYDGKGPLGAWIRRTIANNALDLLRKNKRELKSALIFEEDFKSVVDLEIQPIEEDEPMVSVDRLTKLISSMPTGYRTVFNLYAVEEYTHKEIAEQLNITESTSKTQYRKAKAYMRKLISEELNLTKRA